MVCNQFNLKAQPFLKFWHIIEQKLKEKQTDRKY